MTVRYSTVLQELANEFPPESRIHKDEQSLGQRILNAFAVHLEDYEQEQTRQGRNTFVATSNLDEIDWLYKVELDSSFDFGVDDTDPFIPTYNTPTASGTIDGSTYVISGVDGNSLDNFWYKAYPSRVSTGTLVDSGIHLLLDSYTNLAPFSGFADIYQATNLHITVAGGVGYIGVNDRNQLERAKVIVHGTTRKGISEQETIVFPWDLTQTTFKEWESVDKIECLYFPSGVSVQVRADNYNNGPYIDFWNLAHNKDRYKVDTFWDVVDEDYGSVLDYMMYTTGDVQQLIGGLYDIYAERRFELLDLSGSNVDIIDIAQQPFSNYIWAVTSDKILCYDSYLTTVSGTSVLNEITDNVNSQIDLEFQHAALGDEIQVECFVRNIENNVVNYQLWVEYPDATISGVVDGSLVSYTPNTYSQQTMNVRQIDRPFTFIPDQRGEHIFRVQAVLLDGSTEKNVQVLCVDSKIPVAEFAMPSGITGINGLAFDSDQDLWISANAGYHPISFAYDSMLIDYDNKVIYFRENYDEVYISDA